MKWFTPYRDLAQGPARALLERLGTEAGFLFVRWAGICESIALKRAGWVKAVGRTRIQQS